VAAALLAVTLLVATTADWPTLGRAAAQVAANPLPLTAALVAYTAGFALRAMAWGGLLPVAVPFGRRLRALFAMLAVNHALPGPVGELARARVVADPPDLTFGRALVSIAAARVVDAGCLALLAVGAAAVAGGAPTWLRWATMPALALPWAAWAVARRRGAALTASDVARVAAYAIPSWALETGMLLAVSHAAGLRLGVAAVALATCGGLLAQVVAVLPGGVGTYEAGVTSVLVVMGVPAGEALAVAATTHALKFLYAFAVGLPAIGWRRPSEAIA
jgi:uncharacterized membrane protein YbhN (UPF0104 family)